MATAWQYTVRQRYLESDLVMFGLSKEDIDSLRTADFDFYVLERERDKKAAREFIKKYEWLGTVGPPVLYYFGAYLDDLLGGIILMSLPYNNEKHPNELTISRGACASWSPKNLASRFLMWCIDWIVDNTNYRIFSAYGDKEAHEVGTIYQACNFIYLGDKWGCHERKRFYHPYTGKLISDRTLRMAAMYKQHAERLGIEWKPDWDNGRHMQWDNVPPDIALTLRKYGWKVKSEAKFIAVPTKHKYLFIKGRDKRETKRLRHGIASLPYPKR